MTDYQPRSPAYIQARVKAAALLNAGKIKAYEVTYAKDTGRMIRIETDAGWDQEPFYVDHPITQKEVQK